MADYGMRTTYPGSIEQAEAAITAALKEVGFGVLTRIDVAATLKNKLGIDKPPYVILGACNPKIASQALEMEKELGLLLPCNVIVYEDDGNTVIAAVDPEAMLSIIGRADMQPIAAQVKQLLAQAIAAVGRADDQKTSEA